MNRSVLRVVASSTAVLGGILALAAPAGAHGRSIVVKPGESIQAAVDAAPPGATIYVKRGTYAENVAITKDGITLLSRGAKLVPPTTTPPRNACSFGDPATDPSATEGICVVGDVSFPDPEGPPVVNAPVRNVTISGFDVAGFPGSGIFFLGADNPVVSRNVTTDNEEYGIVRFSSGGGKIVGNTASGSAEAGIYVGDSPNADVLVAGNEASDNEQFGFFFRDAAHGDVVGNRAHGNCIGAIVLNTGGNVAADWRFTANKITENTRFCPANEEEQTDASSGIGIAIAGGADNKIYGNYIRDNTPSGAVDFAGGVVVADIGIPGANPPSDNVVKRNIILGNQPDILWDGSGTGNVFERNLCRTSVPDGLCGSWDSGHDRGSWHPDRQGRDRP
jgi:parallel beta-helix repeat protein